LSPILKVDSTRSMRKSVRWSTAFHEAGHAVASWNHGFEVHSATIVRAADLHGWVEHDNPLLTFTSIGTIPPMPTVARNWRSSCVSRGPKLSASTIRALAADLALTVNQSSFDAASAYLRWLEIVARDEVTASWLYIERVASALAERDTLTAAEIAEILSRNDEAPRPAVSESS
jgi:hypothetical protein